MKDKLSVSQQRKANLEKGRKEAGKHATTASFQLIQAIEREEKSILQVCVHIPEDFFSYEALPGYPQAGDVIGIFPQNTPEHQDILKQTLNSCPLEKYFLKGKYETDKGSWYTADDVLAYISLNPVKIEVLQLLHAALRQLPSIPSKMHESSTILHNLLELHAHNPEACRKVLSHTHLTDVLRAFPGLLDLQDICTLQGANYRRVYTISGINKVGEQGALCIQFMVATGVQYTVPAQSFNPGQVYNGVCSGYLRDLLRDYSHKQKGIELEVFTQRRMFGAPEKSRRFIPNDLHISPQPEFLTKLRLPLLMIAAGSGISGIRAILEERFSWKKQGYEVGTSTLLLGIRNRRTDYLYEADWKRFQQAGLIDKIILAESRPTTGEKRYVQNLLATSTFHSELRELADQRRCLVICGDCRMGNAILQGYLPLLLPKANPSTIPLSSHFLLKSNTREALQNLHQLGTHIVSNLREQGFIIMSASGSRYPKSEVTFEEIFQQLCDKTLTHS